ncbi:2-succinyl-6-hydroxy-2, 4-cyclohexadiene-1-carboxylate synthase [Rubritalea halochordaticola]|uniref:2-succinyl-6-hydroxy-2, 4-cyclohexadiene-1-carboxylate synthase n=1 Tax=Rubritalea halochordaticola TaxID=714537 RepID=A0ABP9UUZ1_9BACT
MVIEHFLRTHRSPKIMIYALHGALGQASDWNHLAVDLKAQNQRLAKIDLWQFLACCPMPLSKFGAAFNREVQDKSPVILGYSMGGRLALHALLDQPKRWRKAVIVSAHTGLPSSERSQRQAKDAEWAAKALKGHWEEFLQEWNEQSVLSGISMPDRSQLKKRREAVARSFMDWSVGAQDDLLPRLSGINCPVLWVVGERDTKFLEVAKQAVSVLQQGELCVVPDCGHRVPWEKPEIFSAKVQEFLEQ